MQTSSLQQKICLLGDFGVGKTSLVRRFVEGKFEEKYLSTVGVNISRKALQLGNVGLTYLLWDLNGGSRFDVMLASYCGGAVGAIIVGDLSRAETFEKMGYYAENFKKLRPQGRLIFVGNKADLQQSEWRIDPAHISHLAHTYDDAPMFLTSAKSGSLVEEVFLKLGELTLKK